MHTENHMQAGNATGVFAAVFHPHHRLEDMGPIPNDHLQIKSLAL
jgi:hypothetical protein